MQINFFILNRKILVLLSFFIFSLNSFSEELDSLKRKKNSWSHFGLTVGYNYSKSNIESNDGIHHALTSTINRGSSIAFIYFSKIKPKLKFSTVSEIGINNIGFDLEAFETNVFSGDAKSTTSSVKINNIYLQSGLKYSIKKFYINTSLNLGYAYKASMDENSRIWKIRRIQNPENGVNMSSPFQVGGQVSFGIQTKALWVDYRFYKLLNNPLISDIKNYNYYGMGIRLIIFPKVFFSR